LGEFEAAATEAEVTGLGVDLRPFMKLAYGQPLGCVGDPIHELPSKPEDAYSLPNEVIDQLIAEATG
jgi:hypothetical protein